MSSANCPMIVNCGSPSPDHEAWRPYARSTAAHSTLTLEESSSAEFAAAGGNGTVAPDAPLTGPLNAQAAFADQGDNLRVKGSHEGYLADFGVSHARQFLVAPNGLLISSEDKLSAPAGLKSPDGSLIAGEYAIRFHLHPSVRAEMAADGKSALLMLRNGETWKISSNAPETRIEESYFLADARGPQQSSQVVLGGMMGEATEVRIVWNIERATDGGDGGHLVDPNEATPAAA
jgi:uncharacterized heparinase superfamily protein